MAARSLCCLCRKYYLPLLNQTVKFKTISTKKIKLLTKRSTNLFNKTKAINHLISNLMNHPYSRRRAQRSNGFANFWKSNPIGKCDAIINPHTSFFFRGELHVVSEEGLNAYGATTWGQFFIYQGFNEKTGWMHISTGTTDEFKETILTTYIIIDTVRHCDPFNAYP